MKTSYDEIIETLSALAEEIEVEYLECEEIEIFDYAEIWEDR